MLKITIVVTSFFALSIFSGCGKKITFLPSSTVPAAQGSVKVKKDKNENYAINLNVRNLIEPERLQPPKENYIVWVETEDNRGKTLGKIRSSKGPFSKTLKGELETVTSFRPVRFFITAENEDNPQHPGPQIVLSTKIFKVR